MNKTLKQKMTHIYHWQEEVLASVSALSGKYWRHHRHRNNQEHTDRKRISNVTCTIRTNWHDVLCSQPFSFTTQSTLPWREWKSGILPFREALRNEPLFVWIYTSVIISVVITIMVRIWTISGIESSRIKYKSVCSLVTITRCYQTSLLFWTSFEKMVISSCMIGSCSSAVICVVFCSI